MISPYSHPCPICREERADQFKIYFDGSVKLFRCSTCGFVGHFPGPGTFAFTDYPAMFAGGLPSGDLDRSYTGRSPRNVEDIIARIRKYRPPPARVLDIGCFTGYFMTRLKASGYSVEGVEASEAIAQYARDKTRLPVHAGLYARDLFHPEQFDVITLLNVFHQMPDPLATLSSVSYHLRPGGYLVLDVPSLKNPLMLLYSATRLKYLATTFPSWSAVNNPQIVAYYHPDTLREVLCRAGFNLQEMTTGRYSVKYFTSSPILPILLRAVDRLCQLFEIGTVLAISRRDCVELLAPATSDELICNTKKTSIKFLGLRVRPQP